MKPGDTSKKREQHRAELLHGIFSKVSAMGLTYAGMYRRTRRLAGSGRFLKSYKRWEWYFLAWKKDPRPETLRRKWRSVTRESSAEFVPAIVAFAIGSQLTLHEAHGKLRLPVSYATVFRHCRGRLEIARLAAIRRAQERLSREENAILKKLREGMQT